MSTPYQGVILAAGGGSRMGALSEHYPKALLPVANVPLIIRHIETLKRLGVHRLVVVVGHQASLIEAAVGDGQALGVTIRYVHQQERYGLAHAVAAVEACIDAPFYLLLGDIYFEFSDLSAAARRFEYEGAAAVLAVQRDADLAAVQRNFSVEMEPGGRVRQVVEKPTDPTARCKGCGFYLFDHQIFEAIRKTPRSSLRNEFELTDAIQILIEDDAPVYGVEMTEWDVNITQPADLIACTLSALAGQGKDSLVGPGCEFVPGAILDHSAAGEGVRVLHPIRLERCVILPDTVVDSPVDLSDAIIAPGFIVR